MSITQFTSYIGGRTRAAGLGLALTSAAAFGTSGSFADVVAALTGLVLGLDPSGGLDGAGVAWGLVAATGLAVFFVASARTDPELPPLVVAWAGMVVGSLTLLGFGLVGLLPVRTTAA